VNPNFKKYLLHITQATACNEVEVIQSLWSGYGNITRYVLTDSPYKSVVIKCIALNKANNHPRGWDTNNSHNRKVKSYEVETHWYEQWSNRCSIECRIPKFIGSFGEGYNQWIVMEDLNTDYPLRKYELTLAEVKACLKWLANFHARFINEQPNGLWEVGTYWHLATRPDEWEKINHLELKAKAHLIDQVLNNCMYKTIVHGDAKLANFCFGLNGQIAAVDFQYVGGGCGMKDVAYFLGSCLTSAECEKHEKELLDYYFAELSKAVVLVITPKRAVTTPNRAVTTPKCATFDFKSLETEWRKLYPFACVDFTRFLLGWMPNHQKINDYNLKMVEEVLHSL